MIRQSFIFFIGLLTLLNGCAVPPYIQDGISLSDPNSYSRITSDLNKSQETIEGRGHIITFDLLNGKTLGPPFSGSRPTEIYLRPGEYYFQVQFFHYGSIARACLELKTEAGVNYIVRHKAGNYSVAFWMETMDGRIAGNLCGFEPDSGEYKSVHQADATP
jgi:hypothetical protein